MLRSRRLVGSVWGGLWFGLLMVALLACPAYGEKTPQSQAEAMQWIQESMNAAKITNVKLQDGFIHGYCGDCTSGTDFSIPLFEVSSASISYPKMTKNDVVVTYYTFPYLTQGPGRLHWTSTWFSADKYGEEFRGALLYLSKLAMKDAEAGLGSYLQDFKSKAVAWQQMAVKPALPEEARRHQVLAEYAYKNKDVAKAIMEYTAALNIYPYWPDGQSNVANLCAELGTRRGYDLAVFHMQVYLMLVPNAPDAKAAQDSIFIWADKRNSAAQ